MTKVRWEAPATVQASICWARAGLERRSPSTHRATSLPPLGSLARMAAPSFSRAPSIWAWLGFSGRRTSGSSVTVSLQKADSRFWYSSQAAVKCFSFSLPTHNSWMLTTGASLLSPKTG